MPGKKHVKKTRKKPARSRNMSATLKRIERSVLSIRMHPVAVEEAEKDKALEEIKRIYSKSSDSMRQHILMIIHEEIARCSELKSLETFAQCKAKTPKAAPGAIRMAVYKGMFNYNTSAEGISDLISLLGQIEGPGPAKLLTRLYTSFCNSETELFRMLRNATLDSLGESKSPYALKALLRYASLSDNEKALARLSSSLIEWDEKIEGLSLDAKEKVKLRKELHEVLTREEIPSRQYG